MDDEFFSLLADRPFYGNNVPSNDTVSNWALKLIRFLYPDNLQKSTPAHVLKTEALVLRDELAVIIKANCAADSMNCTEIALHFFDQLPSLYQILNSDIQAIFNGDPAAQSEFEVIRTYPGFYAICYYRIANILSVANVPLIPRILTEHAHSKTGIDIHPAATIGAYFYIDHGTGIVIGETTIIGNHVKLYQGVTLGALSVRKNLAGAKRHPTVEDSVIIYSGATILGGETVIGHNSIIGGNVWITESVQPYSTAYHSPIVTVRKINETNEI